MALINHILNAPIALITLGVMVLFKLRPPRRMNAWYGYRTSHSMKSQEHWDLAQKLSANSGIYHMSVLLALQIAAFLFSNENIMNANWVLVLWVLSFVMIIAGVEKRLKQLP